MLSRIPKLRFFLLLVFVLPVKADEVPKTTSFQGTYSVAMGGVKLGESTRIVRITDFANLTSTHQITPNPMLILFGISEKHQKSVMELKQKRVRIIETTVTEADGTIEQGAKFNWEDRIIKLASGNQIKMPTGNVHDVESWLMELAINPWVERSGTRVSLVENNKIQTYLYDETESITVDVSGEQFTLLRFKIQSITNKEREYTVSLSPEHGPLPIRIIAKKGSTILEFAIKQVGVGH